MNQETFARALRMFMRRRPFRRFAIQLLTGEQLDVAHPEVVYLDGEVIVYLATNKRYRVFDSSSVCDLLDPRHLRRLL